MRLIVLIFLIASMAQAQSTIPATQSIQRRPGYRIVDGYWTKPQATLLLSDLLKVTDESGRHLPYFSPTKEIEPMLRNGRTSVVEIKGNPFAWKLSTPNRVWNENHTEGTQHLELIAVTDEMQSSPIPALTRISIRPEASIIQAIVEEDKKTKSIIIVMTRSYVELAITPAGQVQTEQVYRAPSARWMLRNHPTESRTYLIPILQMVAGDVQIMQPAAGDVYRVFPDLPLDPVVTDVLSKIITDMADPDPRFRSRAVRDLNLLGRRGVQSAMRLDLEKLPPSAADMISSYIRKNTLDERPANVLRIDSNFLLDCLADPDPAVQKAANESVEIITKTSH